MTDRKGLVVKVAHMGALRKLLGSIGQQRFRLADLSSQIYPLTNPRSREAANELASRVLRAAAKEGVIRREGHLHWIKVERGRKLINGEVGAELEQVVTVSVGTRCPEKWVAVDLETGEVFAGTNKGEWKRASAQQVKAATEALAKS